MLIENGRNWWRWRWELPSLHGRAWVGPRRGVARVARSSKFVPVDVPEDLPAMHGRARTWIVQRAGKSHRSRY